jgi:ribosomal protein S3
MPTRDELYADMATMQTTIREFLAPIATEHNKPLDPGLVSAVMFERGPAGEGGAPRWVVHLYTLSPGLVLGPKGTVADRLRAELCRVSGDPNLWLNLIDFAKIHAARNRLVEAEPA